MGIKQAKKIIKDFIKRYEDEFIPHSKYFTDELIPALIDYGYSDMSGNSEPLSHRIKILDRVFKINLKSNLYKDKVTYMQGIIYLSEITYDANNKITESAVEKYTIIFNGKIQHEDKSHSLGKSFDNVFFEKKELPAFIFHKIANHIGIERVPSVEDLLMTTD